MTPDPLPAYRGDAEADAAWQRVLAAHCAVDEDIYPGIAHRLLASGVAGVALEVGGGYGPLAVELAKAGVASIVADLSPDAWDSLNATTVQADAVGLPFADESFDAVSAINCLYFVADPVAAVREARRVLRPGGWFVASSPARTNDPELEGIDPRWGQVSSFDAEDSPEVVAAVFDDIDVDRWDITAFRLPDEAAVRDYMVGFRVPEPDAATAKAGWPLSITKRGAQVWARKH